MTALSRLMKTARESVEGLNDEVDAEVQAEALADTSLTADVLTEVQGPAAELDSGLQEVTQAEANADSLDNTAAMLNETLDDGGQGVDPVAAELVSDQIAVATERYMLATKHMRPAREAFATSSGRRAATLALAKEAEDTSKSLRERGIAAIKKAIEWLTELFKTVTDKAFRIEKRAKALAASAKTSKAAGGQELKINASFLGAKGVSEVARDLVSITAPLGKLADSLTGGEGHGDIDLNPNLVGNVKMVLENKDGKMVFTKEAGGTEDTKCKALPANVAGTVAGAVAEAAGKIKAAKVDFDKLTKNSLTIMGALKTEGGVKDRAAAVSSVNATSRAAASVVSLALATASRLLDVVDASLNAKEAKAPEAAGAAA